MVSAYNAENHIRRCVNSILAQSFTDYEVVLFDDASTDSTLSIIKQYAADYPDKVVVGHSSINLGPGGGKNAGMGMAKGRYICFCDSDDFLGKNYLLHINDALLAGDYPDILVSAFTETDLQGNERYTRIFTDPMKGLFQSYAGWTRQYKREFIEKRQLSIPAGRVLEDVLFLSAIVLEDPSVAVNTHAEYYYVDNPNSITNTSMKSFIKGAIELEMDYYSKLAEKHTRTNKKDLLHYLTLRCVCWHLLKGGAGIGTEKMEREYETAFSMLAKICPDWQKSRQISWLRPEDERQLVRYVVQSVKLLNRLGLSKWFFSLYAKVNLEKLWPKL